MTTNNSNLPQKTPRFDPSLNHQSFSLYKSIYEPSEDTFLMCDALKLQLENGSWRDYILHEMQGRGGLDSENDTTTRTTAASPNNREIHVMEMGPGSGYCVAYMKNMLNYLLKSMETEGLLGQRETEGDAPTTTAFHTHLVDINQKALDETKITLQKNGIYNEQRDHFYHASLFQPFKMKKNQMSQKQQQDETATESPSTSSPTTPHDKQLFDFIIFNPPYVQSEDEDVEVENSLLSAWAGGERGRVIIDQFIDQLGDYLRGFCYLLLEDVNNVKEVRDILLERYNLQSELVIKRRVAGENLSVIKIWKANK